MSIWTKILIACVLQGLLAAGLGFWMDLYGIRRGCFASQLDGSSADPVMPSHVLDYFNRPYEAFLR